MSAGILEYDRLAGVGEAWHKSPKYTVCTDAVPVELARKVLDFTVTKERLSRLVVAKPDFIETSTGQAAVATEPDHWEAVNAYALVRTDHNHVVCDAVGPAYTVVQNIELLNRIEQSLLVPFVDKLHIDSAGTLWNGNKCFINLGFAPFTIPGDGSETVSKIMLVNCHGGLRNMTGAHTTRFVCNNTMRIGIMEATLNKTLAFFVHRRNIGRDMTSSVINMAEAFAGIDGHKAWLASLTEHALGAGEENAFLEALFPVMDGDGTRKADNQLTRRESVHAHRQRDETMSDKLRGSWYGLIQSVTWFADQPQPRQKKDDGTRYWDGLYGDGDELKQRAVELCPVKQIV